MKYVSEPLKENKTISPKKLLKTNKQTPKSTEVDRHCELNKLWKILHCETVKQHIFTYNSVKLFFFSHNTELFTSGK